MWYSAPPFRRSPIGIHLSITHMQPLSYNCSGRAVLSEKSGASSLEQTPDHLTTTVPPFRAVLALASRNRLTELRPA